ncbi:MAG TPA: hypothetical protein DD456_13525 [Stenotrophomonas sp.]|nr:hypothetical protein [Stenotrophomonas sp.]
MDSSLSMFTGIVGLGLMLFLFLLALLWFFLPFAVFGVKDRITRLERKIDETNQNIVLLIQHAASVSYYAKRADERATPALPPAGEQ